MENSNPELIKALESLPGVAGFEILPSRSVHSNREKEHRISVQFSQDSDGTAERLLALFVAERTKSSIDLESSAVTNAPVTLTCNAKQINGVSKALTYASTIGMSEQPSEHETKQSVVALPILLSHCLAAFERDYVTGSGIKNLPSLSIWSNLLRVLDTDPIPQNELNRRTIITTRTRRVVLKECEALGWIEILRTQSPRTSVSVKLTDKGMGARRNAERRIEVIEDRWRKANLETYPRLVSALHRIVEGFDLEYPYYRTGYGPADDGLTGGAYLPAEEGPPAIPARGEEWPVVLRKSHRNSTTMPLSALLSQAFAGFAIEYEMEKLGRLGHILTLFRYVGDEGVTLDSVRTAGGITGNGRSLHERHMNIVLEPGKPKDNSRTVYLTPKSRRARDSYSFLVHEVESRWCVKHGSQEVNELRAALQSLSHNWQKDLPDYPNTTRWMVPWFSPYKVQE